MKEFTIEIERELLEKVRAIAKQEGCSRNEQICCFVKRYLKKPEVQKILESAGGEEKNAP